MNENTVTVEQLLQIIGDKEVHIAVLRGTVAALQKALNEANAEKENPKAGDDRPR